MYGDGDADVSQREDRHVRKYAVESPELLRRMFSYIQGEASGRPRRKAVRWQEFVLRYQHRLQVKKPTENLNLALLVCGDDES